MSTPRHDEHLYGPLYVLGSILSAIDGIKQEDPTETIVEREVAILGRYRRNGQTNTIALVLKA